MVREPLESLRAERFEIDHLKRSKLGIVERVVAHKLLAGSGKAYRRPAPRKAGVRLSQHSRTSP